MAGVLLDLDLSDLDVDMLSITTVRDALALPETGASSGSSSCSSSSCCGSCSCCCSSVDPEVGVDIPPGVL